MGCFRIARRVAKDRVISTVDPDARHGHKTAARGFDGYKGHVAIDPDSELIVATAVTAGNAADASAVDELLADDLPPASQPQAQQPQAQQPEAEQADAGQDHAEQPEAEQADAGQDHAEQPEAGQDHAGQPEAEQDHAGQAAGASGPLSVYGDSAYGTGEVLDTLEPASAEIYTKTQPPTAPDGRFAKDKFKIDLDAATVTCPAAHTVALTGTGRRRVAKFAHRCAGCPLANQCTDSTRGRTIHVGAHEQQLTRARERQQDPDWTADYNATRPTVERKIAHLTRRKHGGRRARVRGKPKVSADFQLLAAAVNLARLAVLGLTGQHGRWQPTTA
jgi:Transposase DDE domain